MGIDDFEGAVEELSSLLSDKGTTTSKERGGTNFIFTKEWQAFGVGRSLKEHEKRDLGCGE